MTCIVPVTTLLSPCLHVSLTVFVSPEFATGTIMCLAA